MKALPLRREVLLGSHVKRSSGTERGARTREDFMFTLCALIAFEFFNNENAFMDIILFFKMKINKQ